MYRGSVLVIGPKPMPLIGDEEFPRTNIDAAIATGQKLAAQFHDQEFDVDSCATCLGYRSSKNGAFRQLLADLRKFGLLTGRGRGVRVTDRLQRLTVPRDADEFAEAKLESMNAVPLFRALFERFQGTLPSEEELTVSLLNRTKGDRTSLRSWSPRIRANLAAGWARRSSLSRATPPAAPGTASPSPILSELPERRANTERVTFSAGDVRLEFPLTSKGLRLMKANLESEELWVVLSAEEPRGLQDLHGVRARPVLPS
jgi:hypothetical protein